MSTPSTTNTGPGADTMIQELYEIFGKVRSTMKILEVKITNKQTNEQIDKRNFFYGFTSINSLQLFCSLGTNLDP